ncbi:unnamed protein product [Sphagnum compactum]
MATAVVSKSALISETPAWNSLKVEPEAAKWAEGCRLRFLSNVDAVDVACAVNGLEQETTLVVVVSKTFTTAETMLNARTLRAWITSALGQVDFQTMPLTICVKMALIALQLVKEFGIDPDHAFAFWDWVGGRAVGAVPLSLQYGLEAFQRFLEGARSIDTHYHNAPLKENLPVLLGLLTVWNVSFHGCPALAILPYCQALQKLPPHYQQVSMESNGKGVSIDGIPLPFDTGEIDFGEPGTNCQHSFFQLIHQVISWAEVISCKSLSVPCGSVAFKSDCLSSLCMGDGFF